MIEFHLLILPALRSECQPLPPNRLRCRLAEVRSGSGSAASGPNLDQTWRSGSGRTVNLNLDVGSGPVRVQTRFDPFLSDPKSRAAIPKQNEGVRGVDECAQAGGGS